MAVDLPPEARCVQCGYSLRALADLRCPECGIPFDPDDPNTYKLPRRLRPKKPRLTPLVPERPGLTVAFIAVAAAIAAAYLTVTPFALAVCPQAHAFLFLAGLGGWLYLMRRITAIAVGTCLLVSCAWWMEATSVDEHLLAVLAVFVPLLCLYMATAECAARWIGRRWPRLLASYATATMPCTPRQRRVMLISLIVFWTTLIWPTGPRLLCFWISAPAFSARAERVLAADRSEFAPEFVGVWPTSCKMLRPRGTIEFLTTSEAGGIIYVPPGQEMGWPYRTTRMWPSRNWYYFAWDPH